ncbi:hypothetical protein PBY51_011886 [Eleginops maclovinus]|uniref:Uncharacterized protein n=1 Tax=Eleginops maclovinus TaxID=56733 RepID=A0AAN8ASV3_ELEMC|nr:hypothetical protein PBY51_011886 [Eleginops maclovinus]
MSSQHFSVPQHPAFHLTLCKGNKSWPVIHSSGAQFRKEVGGDSIFYVAYRPPEKYGEVSHCLLQKRGMYISATVE